MKYIHSLILIISLFLFSCSNSSSEGDKIKNNNQTSESYNQPSKSYQQKSINGVYSYSDNSAKSIVTVSGNRWNGKLVIISGFGDTYDNSNASYSSGIVKDGILYDDSGYLKLGSANGTSLTIQISSSMVTHYK